MEHGATTVVEHWDDDGQYVGRWSSWMAPDGTCCRRSRLRSASIGSSSSARRRALSLIAIASWCDHDAAADRE
jgi:hypothetical protein